MKQIFNKIFKLLWKGLLTFLGLTLLYLLSAWLLSKIPVNTDAKQPDEGVEVTVMNKVPGLTGSGAMNLQKSNLNLSFSEAFKKQFWNIQ